MTFPIPSAHPQARSLRLLLAGTVLATFAAAAQAPGDVRVALVIGNSAYAGAAALLNPSNDAAAMSATLKTLGFTVVELKDGSRAQMTEAVAGISDNLKGRRGIGMLYYAGHGLQVDFRNYMVPVDAKLASARDVPGQTVDVANVIDAFKTAGNRMNIVVLDACRDNPFAGTGTAKGLAPLDAPSGTFLAYSTAPGNVAEDGGADSEYGLYTGYLVKELQRPAARIEDVFKRVRLQVRQSSKGRQIPWESTSLEEDFFFNDGAKYTFKPHDLERLAAEAKRRQDILKQREAEARERERQAADRLEAERQRATALIEAQAAEERRLAAEVRERENQRLSQQAKAREEARRAEELRQLEERRLQQQAQARERETLLALDYQRQQQSFAAAALAVEAARKLEEARLKALAAAAEEREQRARRESADKLYAQEKSHWNRIAGSNNPRDFYEFLERYPSGSFSEQAVFGLNRKEKPQLAPATISGSGVTNSLELSRGLDRFRAGDEFEVIARDNITKLEVERGRFAVQGAGENALIVATTQGGVTLDDMGSLIRDQAGSYEPPLVLLPSEYALGKSWSGRAYRSGGPATYAEVWYKSRIVGRETIATPVGTFSAWVIETSGSILPLGTPLPYQVRRRVWAVPYLGVPLKQQVNIRTQSFVLKSETIELAKLKPGN